MRNLTLHDLFHRNAMLHGDRMALKDGAKATTHRELMERIAGLAGTLAQQGVAKGDRIAILANNCEAYVLVMGAAACLGAILVPLNWRLSEDELHHILDDAAPAWIFFDEAHGKTIESLSRRGGFPPHRTSLENLPASSTAAPVDPEATAVAGEDPFCLIYTAAVEGRSRGAVLSHHNVIFSNIQTIATLGLTVSDRYLNMLPLFHITGINLAFSILHAGGTNVIMDRFDPARAAALAESEEITLLGSFPPILSKLMETLDQQPRALHALRHVVGLDHPDTISAFERRAGCRFWTLYGQTETSGFVTLSPASENPGSAGRQGLLTNYRIVDEQHREVPTGETGEIVVRGPLVFQGFWRQPAYNDRIFRNGWHHTGDLGSVDAGGVLWFKGRKPEKELIKPGGENVYPAEVEAVLLSHAAVEEAVVIGVPDPQFGEGVKAVCVLAPGRSVTPEALTEFVASRIARYKKPRYVAFVERLPKHADGSIDRAQVKALYGKA